MTTNMIDVQDEHGPAATDLSALAEQLVATARTQGVVLTGPAGLLTGLTRQVLETALETELGEHLGHERGERSGSGNVRNGPGAKTVRTDVGEVRISVPRDRAGTFTPVVVPKHARRLTGFDDAVLARGQQHNRALRGVGARWVRILWRCWTDSRHPIAR
jgi:putative transposase